MAFRSFGLHRCCWRKLSHDGAHLFWIAALRMQGFSHVKATFALPHMINESTWIRFECKLTKLLISVNFIIEHVFFPFLMFVFLMIGWLS
jgi:hypothetical protein